jgi:hypothetical protein
MVKRVAGLHMHFAARARLLSTALALFVAYRLLLSWFVSSWWWWLW